MIGRTGFPLTMFALLQKKNIIAYEINNKPKNRNYYLTCRHDVCSVGIYEIQNKLKKLKFNFKTI